MSPRCWPAWPTGRPIGESRRSRRDDARSPPPRNSRRTPHEALHDAQPAGRARPCAQLHRPPRRRRRRACRNSRRCATARATSRTTRSRISTSISSTTRRRCVASGGHVHYAAGRGGGARDRPRHLPRGSARRTVTKGKSMIAEEIGLNEVLEANGIEAGRDRSRRIHHPAPRRGALAHHRAGDPSDQAATSRHEFRKAHIAILPPNRDLSEPEQLLAEARARAARRKFLAADVGITGANFLVAETGHLDHRHQRGQRRPHADPAEGPYRPRLAREDRADAGGRGAAPARARALGDRAGHVGLHDVLDRPAPRRTIPTGPSTITSSSSTTAAPRCSAASSRTCCAASAAAPA